ncbi:hypothetical protein NR800_24595 [Corallococcus interemptor]|uniref:hypothetical protein n=1 Tax=Corallococcus TaxID=83461 RepID=UPI001CBD78BA|nr:hypothetical protein [Corallococcus sp. AS-1-12]MBZ4332316.1 hypothetical protein [Corallococcus sp. AS-1-12]
MARVRGGVLALGRPCAAGMNAARRRASSTDGRHLTPLQIVFGLLLAEPFRAAHMALGLLPGP